MIRVMQLIVNSPTILFVIFLLGCCVAKAGYHVAPEPPWLPTTLRTLGGFLAALPVGAGVTHFLIWVQRQP